MDEHIEIHRYSLCSTGGLNSQSSRSEHPGFLIKYRDGYGAVHSWPELGDPVLSDLLEMLRARDFSHPILQNALHCARVDGEARLRGVSLFDGLDVPPSHATSTLGLDAVSDAVAHGFEAVKVKLGRNLERETKTLIGLHQQFPELRWRLDFNHSLAQLDDLLIMLDSLPETLRVLIDFIEDPTSDLDGIKTQGAKVRCIPIAVDRVVGAEECSGQFRVLKPAVDNMEGELGKLSGSDVQVVVTSYMDHPLGQSYAAWWAGKLRERGVPMNDFMGLKTDRLFETNEFSKLMSRFGPEWIAAEGAGFGFDRVLKSISWEKI